MNPDYEGLVALGLPRLAKGYSYKFYVKDFKKIKDGYTTVVEKQMKNPLCCALRKHFLGIPFQVQGTYIDADELGNPYGQDNRKVRELGLATVEELYTPHWLKAHYVLLGHEAWSFYVRDQEKKEAKKAAKNRAKNAHREAISKTAHFLNKRMP